jgi:hypothetical protein
MTGPSATAVKCCAVVVKSLMTTIGSWSQRVRLALVLACSAAPALIFYVILWRNAVRIPILDDYHIVLDSVSWVSQHHSISGRLLYLLTNEHNGYRLMMVNAITFCEYLLFGKIYFLPLVALGDAFALFIFLIVLRMARIASTNPIEKWILLMPIAWLIFQLQYASALDFSSCSIQNLGVVFFALASINLLDKSSVAAFAVSCIALIFAIASSPSGFFAAPVGFLLLLQKKQWLRMPAWIAAAAAMLLLYLYRYVPQVIPATFAPPAPTSPFAHLNLLYSLAFLGASAARFVSVGPALVLGVLLLAVIAFAAWKGYSRQNPPVFYAMLLVVINALAVSVLRSDLGVAQSLASRYRIYSNLLLVFTYLFVVETRIPRWQSAWWRRICVGSCILVSIAFCCLSDLAGERFLHGKKVALTYNYRTQWQGTAPEAALTSSASLANPALLRQIKDGIYDVNLPYLREAVQDGVYTPPPNP